MTSWRDSASPEAQNDLDQLLVMGIEFAQQQLSSRGEFAPYAAAVGVDGQLHAIAVLLDDDSSPSANNIEACVSALVSQRDSIRAGAIVSDVRLAEEGSDAIRIELEHADGHAMSVFLPYMKKRLRRGFEFGSLQAEPAGSRIWT